MSNMKLKREIIRINKNIFIFYSHLEYFLMLEKYNWIEDNRKNVGLKVIK